MWLWVLGFGVFWGVWSAAEMPSALPSSESKDYLFICLFYHNNQVLEWLVLWPTQTHNSGAHLISGSFAWPPPQKKVGNIYQHKLRMGNGEIVVKASRNERMNFQGEMFGVHIPFKPFAFSNVNDSRLPV